MKIAAFAGALILAFACAAPVAAQQDATLEAQLNALAAAHQGHVTLYAVDLASGKTVAIDADKAVPTASVIKLGVLYEALQQVRRGTAHFDDRLTLGKENQVEGSGVLELFDTPLVLTLKDALTMMVVVSDNTATNLAIDHLGLHNIDRGIQSAGLRNTWLYKKVFKPASDPIPAGQKQFGLGKTTAREMASLMQRFATCDLNAPGSGIKTTAEDQKLCDVAVSMLKNQTDGDSIPRYLHVSVANKTGSLDEVRNDVGIVYAHNGPIVISAFTYGNKDQSWTPDNAAHLLIGRLAKAIVDRWN